MLRAFEEKFAAGKEQNDFEPGGIYDVQVSDWSRKLKAALVADGAYALHSTARGFLQPHRSRSDLRKGANFWRLLVKSAAVKVV